jgi:hypothetical protein
LSHNSSSIPLCLVVNRYFVLFQQEIALITEDACRTATVICRERVEVLVVNRETVMEHCPDVFQNEFQEKFNILK